MALWSTRGRHFGIFAFHSLACKLGFTQGGGRQISLVASLSPSGPLFLTDSLLAGLLCS